MVYLVHHTHAGSQKRWSGPDHDRPLSVRGRQQAEGLPEILGDHPVARILTSPTTPVGVGSPEATPRVKGSSSRRDGAAQALGATAATSRLVVPAVAARNCRLAMVDGGG
jgi:hypothetical protein